MRAALDEALGAPAGGYAAGLASRQPILAAHIQELRKRVLDAWQTGAGGVDVRWLVTDQRGTPRMVVDRTGSLAGVTRHDYLPFGEELSAGAGGRTTTQGYGAADGVRQQFTGYERDDETKLDYAQARYYANVQGRFTTTDPLPSSAKPGQPQSWNRYIYALNNPLAFVDPNGLIWGRATDGDGNQSGSPIWYKDEDAMKAAGATAFTPENWQYLADNGRWVTLNPDGPGSL